MSLWIRPEKELGSSRENPDVSREVSYKSITRSFELLSDSSAENLVFNAWTMGWLGLSSMVFLAIIYLDMVLSRSAWARMIRSMFALHPYSPVTREHGESTIRSEITTFSTLDPRMSLTFLQRPS